MTIFAVCYCLEESIYVNQQWYWDTEYDEVIGYFRNRDDALQIIEDVEDSYDYCNVEVDHEEKTIYISSDIRYRYYIKRIIVQ